MVITSSAIPFISHSGKHSEQLLSKPLIEERYSPVGRIRGGCSSVYISKDKESKEIVAFKFPRLDRSNFADLIRREISVFRRMSHPGVVSMLGYDEDSPYILFEYLGCRSLASCPDLSAVRHSCEILAGLHSRGILHRDINPKNIFIVGSSVKFIDFGFAKIKGVPEFPSRRPFGTVQFISPEQFAGKGTSGLTDIYALGMTLYYVVTGGQYPILKHKTSRDFVKYAKNGQAPLPPSFWNEGISPELCDIVLRSIEKDPEKRFQSAEQMASALAKF
ncbi:serine/threonine protein kinase [Candidatus Micrarchaeota archaeon]|nr:serine/threonine protein kinase [Candidatus Micrarchaeota archaeon]